MKKFLSVSTILLFLMVQQGRAQQEVPRDTSFTLLSTYAKEKKHRPYITIAYGISRSEYNKFRDVTYKTTTYKGMPRELLADIFMPLEGTSRPAVLMVHGGGWNSGNRSLQAPMASLLAAKGIVAIPIEYRLIPEALYPAGERDIEDAVTWVIDNSEKLGIDPGSIFISGCSAGGQLAMLVGMKNESRTIKGVINIDGISTFIDSATIDRAEQAYSLDTKKPVDALWLGGPYSMAKHNWEEASGLNHIGPQSPPVLFINSSIPRFHNGRDEAVEKLSQYGTYTQIHTFEDTPHPFWFFNPWFDQTVNLVEEFIKKISAR